MAGVVRTARQTVPVTLVTRRVCSRYLAVAAAVGGGAVIRGFSMRAVPGSSLSPSFSGRRSFSHSGHWRSADVPKVERGGSKLWESAADAVADIRSGSVVLSSGFGLCGVACKLGDRLGLARSMNSKRLT
jgi:3-oxoacid CoA-transferase